MREFFELKRNLDKPYPVLVTQIGNTVNQLPIHRPQGFPYHHIIWVTEGSGCFEIENETVTLSKGSGIFLPKNVPHNYFHAAATFSTAWITFNAEATLLDIYNLLPYKIFNTPAFWNESVSRLSKTLIESDNVGSRSSAFYSWLIGFLEMINESNLSLYQKVRHFLESNFSQPLTLDDIAEAVSVNKYALCRYYLNEKKTTVMMHLKKIRITQATQYLKFTSLPVSEIGKKCGFDSPSYFGKIFKEVTGYTPMEYKAKHHF